MKKFTLFLTLFIAATMTIFAQDQEASLTATANPSGTVTTIWGEGDVTINFNKAVEYNAPDGGLKILNKDGIAVSNVSSLAWNGDMTRAFVMLDTYITATGTYYLTIPAGAIATADGEVLPETTFTFTVENNVVLNPEWWTDYDYASTVNEFKKITISFDNVTSLKLNLNKDTQPYIATAAGNYEDGEVKIVETEDKDGKKQTKIEITFSKYTEEGNYEVYIPEGMFTMNESVNNSEKSLKFAIVKPAEVTPLEIVSVIATAEGLLEIKYNQIVTLNWDGLSDEIKIFNEQNEEITLIKYTAPEWPSYRVLYTSSDTKWDGWQYIISPIAKGTYTIDVSQVIVKFGYNQEIWDYEAQGSCEGIYTVIYAETAIEDVEAEAEGTVIYDLTGRRINEITKAGIYIVNGVKRVIK